MGVPKVQAAHLSRQKIAPPPRYRQLPNARWHSHEISPIESQLVTDQEFGRALYDRLTVIPPPSYMRK
jgi:hypothetical protein